MRDDRPSATALLIAAEVALLARDPRAGALIPRGAAAVSRALISEIAPALGRVVTWGRHAWVRRVLRAVEGLFLRGLMLHHVVRKRWIEDETARAIREGFGQVVVIGAGLDTLALRLAGRFPWVSFIEVDHPATQGAKAAALQRAGAPERVELVPADLSRVRLNDALARCPLYNPLARTLFIAEGLLMYLDEPRVESLLSGVRGPTGASRRFVFTFMAPRRAGAADFPASTRLLRAWLRRRGEPFKWGISNAHVRDWLAERGFEAREIVGAALLRRQYLAGTPAADEPLAEGEWLCVADAARPMPVRPPAVPVVRAGAWRAAPTPRTPTPRGAG